jgi:hypothetical protein
LWYIEALLEFVRLLGLRDAVQPMSQCITQDRHQTDIADDESIERPGLDQGKLLLEQARFASSKSMFIVQ